MMDVNSSSIDFGLPQPEVFTDYEDVAYVEATFQMVRYVNDEGESLFRSRLTGDYPLSVLLGDIERTKHDLLHDFDYNGEGDEVG